jgi:hypothetical protein
MKSAKQWMEENSQSGPFDLVQDCDAAERLIYEIQEDAAGATNKEVLRMPSWTKERPTEPGFYWYREEDEEPQVVAWNEEMQWAERTGSSIPLFAYIEGRLEGEFWSEKLCPPNGGE